MPKGANDLQHVSSVNVTDGGRALQQSWYVAYTKVHQEKRLAADFNKLGFEAYVATQKEWRQWSDRRKLIDRVVIPLIVFVRCTSKDISSLNRLSRVSYFLTKPGSREKAIIPDDQIDKLRFALDHSESSVIFTSDRFKKGDSVRIRFGSLAGLTGTVTKTPDGSPLISINLDYLGCAMIKVKAEDLLPK